MLHLAKLPGLPPSKTVADRTVENPQATAIIANVLLILAIAWQLFQWTTCPHRFTPITNTARMEPRKVWMRKVSITRQGHPWDNWGANLFRKKNIQLDTNTRISATAKLAKQTLIDVLLAAERRTHRMTRELPTMPTIPTSRWTAAPACAQDQCQDQDAAPLVTLLNVSFIIIQDFKYTNPFSVVLIMP